MSKTIKERSRDLKERETRLKLQLEDSEGELKNTAKSVGKIALVSGLVALLGYVVYSIFFAEEEDEEEEKPKKKKKKKRNSSLSGTLLAYGMPYITKMVDELLEIEDLKKELPEKEEPKRS